MGRRRIASTQPQSPHARACTPRRPRLVPQPHSRTHSRGAVMRPPPSRPPRRLRARLPERCLCRCPPPHPGPLFQLARQGTSTFAPTWLFPRLRRAKGQRGHCTGATLPCRWASPHSPALLGFALWSRRKVFTTEVLRWQRSPRQSWPLQDALREFPQRQSVRRPRRMHPRVVQP